MPTKLIKHTTREYTTFQQAYDFFNTQLFKGQLPQVLIVLQRKSKALGYFHPNRFAARTADTVKAGKIARSLGLNMLAVPEGTERIHELALNPDHFGHQSNLDICDTLVHEMCHVWQAVHGKAPRKAYHDKEWAAKMLEVGLTPSETGKEGGKQTGVSMSDYPTPDGPFMKAFERLAKTGFTLNWQSHEFSEAEKKEAKAKKASKTKYTCPGCDANAWAKPLTLLICGECYDDGNGDIVNMEPQEAE